MIDLESIVGRKINTSVNINGIFVPANSIATAMTTYASPAFFVNPEVPEFEISQWGSLFKAKLGDRFIALLTAHQGAAFEFDQLCIYSELDQRALTSNGCTFSRSKELGEESLDLRLYDFTEVVHSGALPSSGWFDLRIANPIQLSVKPSLMFAIGFPHQTNKIDYEIHHIQEQVFAAYGQPSESALSNRSALKLSTPIDLDPDGFSGSPVFGVILDGFRIELHFLGITTNASRSLFNFVPRTLVDQLLDFFLKD